MCKYVIRQIDINSFLWHMLLHIQCQFTYIPIKQMSMTSKIPRFHTKLQGNRSSPKWHPMTSKWHNCRNSHCADLHVTWRIRDRPIRPEKVEKGQSKASRCQLQSGKTELETTRWSLTNLETFYSKIDKSINFVVDFDCVWSDI